MWEGWFEVVRMGGHGEGFRAGEGGVCGRVDWMLAGVRE
jgi:hypothetical protein